MPSPFPGMDPYLEHPSLWPGLHNSLAFEIHRILNRELPEPYFAQIEIRTEIGIDGDSRRHATIPDVIVREIGRHPLPGSAVAVAEPEIEVSRYWDVTLDIEPYELASIMIRDATAGKELITVIELLSPSNKRPGPDRKQFLRKRSEVLASNVSLVEIDLLRTGSQLWFPPELVEPPDSLPKPDYLVAVSRAWERGAKFRLQLFPVALRDPLPTISVPLREFDAEQRLELQACFTETYDAGPYRRGAIDYTRPPEPPLPQEHQAWAAECAAVWLDAGKNST